MNNIIKNLLSVAVFAIFCSYSFSQENAGKYQIKIADFNSENADFATAWFEKNLIYVSDKEVRPVLNPRDPASKTNVCNIYTNSDDEKIISLIERISTKYNDGPISVSTDGNIVFFTRNSFYQNSKRVRDDRTMPLQIFYVEYRNGIWSEEKDLPFNSTEYSVAHPSLSVDSKNLYFVSDMPGGMGGKDIYKVEFNNGIFGKPENLGENINSSSDELFPYISNKNELYFSSDCKGSSGGLDIYKCSLAEKSFGPKTQLEFPINSGYDDFALIVSPYNLDFEKGYFSSSRPGGKGGDDIYLWESMLKPLKIKGIVTNSDGKQIENTKITLFLDNKMIAAEESDENGNYIISANRKNKYTIKVEHPDYFNDEMYLETNVDELQEFFEFNIELEDNPRIVVKPVNEDGSSITEMNVGINSNNKQVFSGISKVDGVNWELPKDYKRGDSLSITIDCLKTGYLNKTIEYKTTLNHGGDYIVPLNLMIFLKAEESVEISKFIDIQAIYYDFAKWDIRADAAKELDKVINFLNQNPEVSIELSSHTDCRGSDENNLTLSDKRAKSASDFIKAGIKNKSQVYGKGYGEKRPITICPDCNSCSEDQHAQNRRTEFTIVKVSK
jgi:outer membrane protein OmpA-like peptidoglycan-associated protein